ncbi:hypothetical protein CALCODRAFT_51301 [Calocera cornea HHB12733]|uniref:Uncharacterized protein n=1 Tax=Calocera cornea HHB12733 TaxID=1353952 RepID=A0A165DS92_9BASI|nr:hypothetical protein CALCODRAFT_51301 [Calocera cornea HHB12733]
MAALPPYYSSTVPRPVGAVTSGTTAARHAPGLGAFPRALHDPRICLRGRLERPARGGGRVASSVTVAHLRRRSYSSPEAPPRPPSFPFFQHGAPCDLIRSRARRTVVDSALLARPALPPRWCPPAAQGDKSQASTAPERNTPAQAPSTEHPALIIKHPAPKVTPEEHSPRSHHRAPLGRLSHFTLVTHAGPLDRSISGSFDRHCTRSPVVSSTSTSPPPASYSQIPGHRSLPTNPPPSRPATQPPPTREQALRRPRPAPATSETTKGHNVLLAAASHRPPTVQPLPPPPPTTLP